MQQAGRCGHPNEYAVMKRFVTQMKTHSTIRLLLLANEFNAAQILISAQMLWREGHSHGELEIIEARTRDDFFRELEEAMPDVAVVESKGTAGLSFLEILSAAQEHSPEIPVVVLGEDGEDGRDAVLCIEQGAADYIPISHTGRLPLVLARLKRERESVMRERELMEEVQRAHDALLDNQKLMAIGRLAASIAHEINNPLESITNLLYLLRTDPNLSASAETYVGMAEKEMERVAQISKQTLNFYRETRTPVQVRPADLLEEVLFLYSRKIEERQMQVVRQFRTDEKVLVYPGEIRQVLSNLVTNAIEASAVRGRLILRVHRARLWSDEGITGIRIVVADEGTGISAETRQNLGQLFYTTKGQRGTGLGLWVTRAIVQRYGGEIQLYSSMREGRHGTVFSIFLPTNMRPQPVRVNGGFGSGGDRDGRSRRTLGSDSLSSGTHDFAAGTNSTNKFHRKKRAPLVAS
jgi:two-component system NtrC family sensor kinase